MFDDSKKYYREDPAPNTYGVKVPHIGVKIRVSRERHRR